MAKSKNEIDIDELTTARKGRKVAATINEKGRTRVQLASSRKDGSNFDTLTLKEPEPEPQADADWPDPAEDGYVETAFDTSKLD